MGTIEKRPAFSDYWSRLEHRDARRRAEDIDSAPRGGTSPIAAGDTVDIDITGIGTWSNPVVAGSS